MSKISVVIGFRDLVGSSSSKIVPAEFNSIQEMNTFIFRNGIPRNTRVLALVKNLEDHFEEGSDDKIA